MRLDVRRLASFGAIGAAITLLNYVVFTGLIRLGVHYLLASAVGWALGLSVSYVLNRRLTFAVRRAYSVREAATFVGGYVLQFGLGSAVYALLIGGLKLDPSLAFLINLVVVSTFSYTFMRRVTFRPDPGSPLQPPSRITAQ